MSDDATHGAVPATMVVLATAASGRLDEMVRWYREVHIPEVLAVPGFASAEQFVPLDRDGDGPSRVLTLYRFDTADADAPLAELSVRRATMTPTSSLAGATVWVAAPHRRTDDSREDNPENSPEDSEVRS